MPKPVTITTPSDREVTVVREFDAPAQLIWDAHTKPELIKRWLVGSEGWTMPYCMVDLRVGGAQTHVPFFKATPPSVNPPSVLASAPASEPFAAPRHPHVPSAKLHAIVASLQTVPGTISERVAGHRTAQYVVGSGTDQRTPLQYAWILHSSRRSLP